VSLLIIIRHSYENLSVPIISVPIIIMSGFGKWYEEKKNEELGDHNNGSSSWFGGAMADQVLPLFNTDNLTPISWESMKSSMEQQMPKKILGMGYQQRFQVNEEQNAIRHLLCIVTKGSKENLICLYLLGA
jgi:hypothetical protein